MDTSVTYHKDEKVEEIEEEFSDTIAEAIYCHIMRKGLLKRKSQASVEPVKKDLEKYE